MIKHWAKLSCLVLCGQLMASACTTENDDDDSGAGGTGGGGGTTSTSTGGTSTGGSSNGGSAGETPTSTSASTTTASGGSSSGGTAGEAGASNTGDAGAAGASTDGYDGGQITAITGPESVTNGGTFTIQVTIPGADDEQDFQVVVADGDAVTTSATPNDDGVFDISVSIPEDVTGDTVNIAVSPVDGDGDVGDAAEIDPDLIETGTGELKVTLSFDQITDLDLLVREPSGFVISADTPSSDSGGELDIDSNAFCDEPLDGYNLENVFWEEPPSGQYDVGVAFFEACVAEPVNYTVTVTRGNDVETFTGSFVVADAGSEDTGFQEVTSFTIE